MFYQQLFSLLLFVAIGISLPVGIRVPELRVGQYIMLNSRPSKLINKNSEGSGTDDLSKIVLRGIDVITLKGNEEVVAPTDIVETSVVSRQFLEIKSITEDNQVLFKGHTNLSQKCSLPDGKLGARIRQDYKNGKPLLCAVISVGNEQRILGIKATTDRKTLSTYQKSSLKLRDNDYVMLENRPCIITDILYWEDIKNPAEGVDVYGKDIFTSKERSHSFLITDYGDVPYVEKTEYKALEITDDSDVWLGNDSGDIFTIDLPKEPLGDKLKAKFDAGKIVYCSVLKALDEQNIIAIRTAPYSISRQ